MDSFRSEVSIPVNKDSRTFEERQNAIFDNIGEKYSKQVMKNVTTTSKHEVSNNLRSVDNESIFDMDRFFNRHSMGSDSNVTDWLSKSRKQWSEEMSLMKNSMFSLESGRDEFDFKSWDPFNTRKRIDDFSRHGTEIHEENRVIISPSGTEQIRETKQVFSSSSKPIDVSDSMSRQHNDLKPVYEIGQDGQLYFKLRFESKNFRPEDIKVTCTDSNLSIRARKGLLSKDGSSSELHKSISIPSCVNTQKFQCQLTKDGILVLEAPATSPESSSVVSTNNSGRQMIDRSSLMAIRNTSGPIVLSDENGKRIHIEIQVEGDYIPSDFSVTIDINKISVKGRHEVKTANSSSFKEFSKYYEVSEKIDPMSVSLNIVNGILIIEALIV